MTDKEHHLVVSKALVRHQTVELPDGTLIALEAANPTEVYALVYACEGHLPEIISLHIDERSAADRCKQLVKALQDAGEGAEQASVDLQRIVNDAKKRRLN